MFVKQSMCVLFALFFLAASSGLKSAQAQERLPPPGSTDHLPPPIFPRSADQEIAEGLGDVAATFNWVFLGGPHPMDPSTLDGMIRLQRRYGEAIRDGDVAAIEWYEGALKFYKEAMRRVEAATLRDRRRDARVRQAIEAANAQVRHAQSLVDAALREAALRQAQSPAVPPISWSDSDRFNPSASASAAAASY